jgi:cytoskeletal protein RodZ
MDRKIAELDRRYRRQLETKKEDNSPEVVFWQNRATSICNTLAFIVFCAGILLFVVYIINIQARNYREFQSSVRRERNMTERKQKLNEGKTESPKEVTKTTTTPSSGITKHGATETPQAVVRPIKPSGDSSSSGGSKKSE